MIKSIKSIAIIVSLLTVTWLPAQDLTIVVSELVGAYSGPVVQLLTDAGYKVTLNKVPNTRLMNDLNSGKVDGSFFLNDTAISNVKGLKKVPLVLFTTEIVAVSVDSSVKVTKIADLANYKVGVVRGNSLQADITKGLKVTEADNDEALVKMLGGKRFDVALMARSSVYILADKAKVSGVIIQEPALHVTPLYFVLTDRASGEMNKITKIFKDALDSGWWKKEFDKFSTNKFNS